MPHTAALCCNKQQRKTPRAQQYTSLLIPCAHGKLDVKHRRTTPKPETHITAVEKEAALARKQSTNKYASGTTTTTTTTTHTTAT